MNFKIFLIAFTIINLNISVIAGGTETKPVTGTRTLSLNGLYVAGNDGIIKSLTNPAALIYSENSFVEVSVLNRLAQNEFDNPARGLFRSFREDEINFNGGLIWSFSEFFKMAVSYQQAVDYNVSWPFASYFQQDSLSALLAFDFYNQLNVEAVSLSAAYRTGNIILGLSPVAYRVSHKLAFPQSNPLWGSGVGTAAYQFSSEQSAWSFGAVLGLIVEFSEDLKAGLSVRSGYTASLTGEANSRMFADTDSTASAVDVSSEVTMPWILATGMVYRLSESVNINADFQYTLWGSVPAQLNQNYNNQVWQEKLNEIDSFSGIRGNSFSLSFSNTLDAGVGVEYISESGIKYRAGYRFSQTPVKEESYNMLFPEVDQHWISIGAELSSGRLSLEGVVLYGIGVAKEVVRDAYPNLTGRYDYSIVIPMVTLKYQVN